MSAPITSHKFKCCAALASGKCRHSRVDAALSCHHWIRHGVIRCNEPESAHAAPEFEPPKDRPDWKAIEDLGKGVDWPSAGLAPKDALSYVALRSANVRRCEEVFHKLHDWSPTDWACAFAGEAGEACNVVKKLRRLDGADATQDTPEKRAEVIRAIAEEIADAVIYADLLAARLDIDLGEAVREKFNTVSRKRGSTVFL